LLEEKRQDQPLDVRAIDIGVGHDYDLVVATFICIELVYIVRTSNSSVACDNDHSDGFAVQNFVDASLFNVDTFPKQRHNCLRFTVTPLLG
jgi:hypothetical protein